MRSREFEIERVRIGVESTKYNPILYIYIYIYIYIYEIRGKMVIFHGLKRLETARKPLVTASIRN